MQANVKAENRENNRRTSREDWLQAALKLLINEGIEQVKILRLAEALATARSSFYWFFESRGALLDALLETWAAQNTGAITSRAEAPAATITEAVLNVFECWTDNGLFDARLDFAIREWARRAPEIRQAIEAADSARIKALTVMFQRHGTRPQAAFIRARILYFTQIGYYALVDSEDQSERTKYIDDYILGFTGLRPTSAERARFDARLEGLENAKNSV